MAETGVSEASHTLKKLLYLVSREQHAVGGGGPKVVQGLWIAWALSTRKKNMMILRIGSYVVRL
jgi:hypothetical protein